MRPCLKPSLRPSAFFVPPRRAVCCVPEIWIASEFPVPFSPACTLRARSYAWDEAFMRYSIRINDQWRICFEWKDGDAYNVETVDYH